MLPSSSRHGANEFEIISFVESGIGSKLYDVVQKEKKQMFTMEVSPRKQNTKITKSKLRRHSQESLIFLVQLKYSFQTKTRNYFILTHANKNTNLVSMLSHKCYLTEAEIIFVTSELIVALHGLHRTGTVYGGISKDDIYFDSTGHVLLQRTYCGRTYWSADECIKCEMNMCNNIHHIHTKPSEAEKAVDWLSLIRLFTALSTNSCSEVSEDFMRQISNKHHTFSSIKNHEIFSRIKWKKIDSKENTVPINIQQYVNTASTRKHLSQSVTNNSTNYISRSYQQTSIDDHSELQPSEPKSDSFSDDGNEKHLGILRTRASSCIQKKQTRIRTSSWKEETNHEQVHEPITRSISTNEVYKRGDCRQTNTNHEREYARNNKFRTRTVSSGDDGQVRNKFRTRTVSYGDGQVRSNDLKPPALLRRAYSSKSSSELLVEGLRRNRLTTDKNYNNYLDINFLPIHEQQMRKSGKKVDTSISVKTRRKSIEKYRKRLEEISKVLDNNKKVMESLDISSVDVNATKHISPIMQSPVKRGVESCSYSADESNITKKLYSENDSIRLILSKYGLFNEDKMQEADKPITLENNNNNRNDACLITRVEHESLLPPESSKSRTVHQIKIEVIDSDDVLAASGEYWNPNEESVKENIFTSKTENKDTTQEKMVVENDRNDTVVNEQQEEEVYPDDQHVKNNRNDRRRGSTLLLTKLQDLGTTKLKSYKIQPKMLKLNHTLVKRHSSDVTMSQSPGLLRSNQEGIERDQTAPINLNRSTTVPQAQLCKLKPTSQSPFKHLSLNQILSKSSPMNSDDSGLHDINGLHNTDDYGFEEMNHLQRWDSGVAMVEAVPRVQVWKPGQPDPKFLLEEKMKIKAKQSLCYDCGKENQEGEEQDDNDGELYYICTSCTKARTERKEAIIELIQTEVNYGYDLRIIKEEFYIPMKRNSVCTQEELKKLFSNLQELLDVNSKLCNGLQEGLELCIDQDDEDYAQLAVGEVFLDCVEFFEAYEVFCSKQKESLELLNVLKKKSELLRIFLTVSSMENNKLRKMDLKTFLTMPIQRIMKYPLLLSRIYKNTSPLYSDKNVLKLALNKIESQIQIINHKICRSDSHHSATNLKKNHSFSSQQNLNAADLSRLDKYVANLLDWKHEETMILIQEEFDVLNESLVDLTVWNTKKEKKLVQIKASLCIHGASDNFKSHVEDACSKEGPHIVSDVKDAVVVLIKKKSNEKFTLYQQPLDLKDSVVSINPKIPLKFEILERDKTPLIFVPNNKSIYEQWKTTIDFVMISLKLKWRERRGGMSNIMIPTML